MKKLTVFESLEQLGFAPEMIRGKVVLSGMVVHAIIDGYPVNYTRRRYGNATFCWVEYYDCGWEGIGDPWKSITPPKHEVAFQIGLIRRNSVGVDG